MQSIANPNPLPLRNLLIEVRQVQSNQREQQGVRGGGSVQFESGGSASAHARLRLGQQKEQLSGTVTQQALVLNGRSTSIALRSSTPFRLMQTQFRQGAPMLVQGTVLLEASTGFTATPRWDGMDRVELEIATTQAGLAPSRSTPWSSGTQAMTSPPSTSTSTLILPLGEWVTVAQSDMESSTARSGLLANDNATDQHTSELQVRLTVR